jgi:hypothetical protein
VIASINGRLPVLWLFGLLATGVLAAVATPPWVVRNWQSDEGLPDNSVVDIGQTPDGFLWVATKTGLVRFDSVRVQPFPELMGFLRLPAGSPVRTGGPATCGTVAAVCDRRLTHGPRLPHAAHSLTTLTERRYKASIRENTPGMS